MNPLFPAFQVPVATAAGRFVADPKAATIPVSQPLAGSSATAGPLVQQAYKARTQASLATHRAQTLAQRRTTIPSSAKRW